MQFRCGRTSLHCALPEKKNADFFWIFPSLGILSVKMDSDYEIQSAGEENSIHSDDAGEDCSGYGDHEQDNEYDDGGKHFHNPSSSTSTSYNRCSGMLSVLRAVLRATAIILLFHYQWNAGDVNDAWLANEVKVGKMVVFLQEPVVDYSDSIELAFKICFESYR